MTPEQIKALYVLYLVVYGRARSGDAFDMSAYTAPDSEEGPALPEVVSIALAIANARKPMDPMRLADFASSLEYMLKEPAGT